MVPRPVPLPGRHATRARLNVSGPVHCHSRSMNRRSVQTDHRSPLRRFVIFPGLAMRPATGQAQRCPTPPGESYPSTTTHTIISIYLRDGKDFPGQAGDCRGTGSPGPSHSSRSWEASDGPARRLGASSPALGTTCAPVTTSRSGMALKTSECGRRAVGARSGAHGRSICSSRPHTQARVPTRMRPRVGSMVASSARRDSSSSCSAGSSGRVERIM